MKIVNEPTEQVEAELLKDEIQVVREPYDPGSRNLLSDFVGFLRSPRPGSRVTLFEDDRGRVRYYTVAQANPEVAELRTQVSRPDTVRRRAGDPTARSARAAAREGRSAGREAGQGGGVRGYRRAVAGGRGQGRGDARPRGEDQRAGRAPHQARPPRTAPSGMTVLGRRSKSSAARESQVSCRVRAPATRWMRVPELRPCAVARS